MLRDKEWQNFMKREELALAGFGFESSDADLKNGREMDADGVLYLYVYRVAIPSNPVIADSAGVQAKYRIIAVKSQSFRTERNWLPHSDFQCVCDRVWCHWRFSVRSQVPMTA